MTFGNPNSYNQILLLVKETKSYVCKKNNLIKSMSHFQAACSHLGKPEKWSLVEFHKVGVLVEVAQVHLATAKDYRNAWTQSLNLGVPVVANVPQWTRLSHRKADQNNIGPIMIDSKNMSFSIIGHNNKSTASHLCMPVMLRLFVQRLCSHSTTGIIIQKVNLTYKACDWTRNYLSWSHLIKDVAFLNRTIQTG